MDVALMVHSFCGLTPPEYIIIFVFLSYVIYLVIIKQELFIEKLSIIHKTPSPPPPFSQKKVSMVT